ncbi:MAG: DMT family transporter [Anaerolineae bacterium]|jgi:drug/metabolite transporter (DMT)-like permease|nr:DMT family transporter [Anaerolineae bacterium]MBT3712681.1 DMT family transporter [Anaerolineae bacterium]MBT4309735.1 DMT family transporter [Anaerolineae bacterium]MBT4457956.1 DMT family transporter [Anaerolineae bacterium]MBT4841368.1 DMT family transporter [Anaerolineae bacterium]
MFSAFWALQIFVAKLGFIAGAMVLPFQIILIFTTIATLSILLLPKSGPDLGKLFKHQPKLFWELFLANIIQSGLGTYLSIIGIALTDAINAGFLVKLATITTIFFAWLILKEKLSGLKIAVVFVMLIGAYLLTTKGQSLLPKVGDLFILGACFCWSLGNVLVRKIMQRQSVNADVVTMQKPLASLPVFFALIAISVFFPEMLGNLHTTLACCSFDSSFTLYAIASGIALAMAWIYLYRTLHLATASYMTLMSMVTPIIVSVLAILFLGEKLILIQIIGAGMIVLSGVVIYLSDIAYT